MKRFSLTFTTAVLTSALLLAGCNTDTKYRYIETNSSASATDKNMAIISTKGPGDASFATVDLGQSPLHAVEHNSITTGATDYGISAYGKHFYHIGKFQIDTVAKYSIDNPTQKIWQFSTLDASNDTTSNPYSLVFVSEEKAYLIRYGSNKLWIVNPSATTEANFKTGEIDLSEYDYNDNPPNMTAGIIVDGKLFLLLQRLDGWTAIAGNSYIAVFDVNTNAEIDTRQTGNPSPLLGIQLATANPMHLIYHKDVGILVQSIGSYGADKIGGIEKIDINDYSTATLLNEAIDDYKFDNIAIVNANKAYFSQYNGWQNNDLCSFNPSDTNVPSSVECNIAGIQGMPISNLTVDYQNRLWVSISDQGNPRIELIESANDTIVQTITTAYNPETVLITEPEPVFKQH